MQKMVEAKEDVNKMKAELAIKNQELAAATKEAEALLKSISESTAVAEKGRLHTAPPGTGLAGSLFAAMTRSPQLCC